MTGGSGSKDSVFGKGSLDCEFVKAEKIQAIKSEWKLR